MSISLHFAKDKSKFEVKNIYCVGKNYLDHVKEFANYEVPVEPVIFCKPVSALCQSGSSVSIPVLDGTAISSDLQNEVELVLAVGFEFESRDFSLEGVVAGIGVGFDMTLRDVQSVAKSKGLPWTISKGFRNSAPVSELYEPDFPESGIEFSINVNGMRRQHGNSNNMIFDFESILKYINDIFVLQKGDIIFTGTPSGISTLNSGDSLEGFLFDKKVLEINIT